MKKKLDRKMLYLLGGAAMVKDIKEKSNRNGIAQFLKTTAQALGFLLVAPIRLAVGVVMIGVGISIYVLALPFKVLTCIWKCYKPKDLNVIDKLASPEVQYQQQNGFAGYIQAQ